MQYYLVYSLYLFFTIIMITDVIYILRKIIPWGDFLNKMLDNIMKPLLQPMRFIVKHSVLKCLEIDISPYIILIILSYMQSVCSFLLSKIK